jgi:hypothetical protein
LAAAADAVSDPTSPDYRHYLARGQFASTYGAAASTVATVTAALRNSGLQIGALTDGLVLPVTSTVGGAEKAFGVAMHSFRLNSGNVVSANTTAPRLAGSIAPLIQSVVGLDNMVQSQSNDLTPADTPNAGTPATSGPALAPGQPQACGTLPVLNKNGSNKAPGTGALGQEGYSAEDIAAAYNLGPLYQSGDFGQGQTIALPEDTTYRPDDITAYQDCYGTNVTVDLKTISSGALGLTTTQDEAEADIEDVIGLAPKLTRVLVYESSNSTSPVTVFMRIANDDLAQVVSNSHALCESLAEQSGQVAAEEPIFAQMAVQGQSMFSGAGDDGSQGCNNTLAPPTISSLAVDDPASQPYVTAVGGTTLIGSGTSLNANPPTFPPYKNETVWNDGSSLTGAGGGGFSTVWKMPAYQEGPGVINHSYPSDGNCHVAVAPEVPYLISQTGYCREVPDISAEAGGDGYDVFFPQPDANPITGQTTYPSNWGRVVGTSLATPTWAAMTALINASTPQCDTPAAGPGLIALGPVGFLNPALYQLASSSPQDFNDITTGNNDFYPYPNNGQFFPATPGYDMASGLGSPNAANLAQSLCPRDATSLVTKLSAGSKNIGSDISVVPGTNVTDRATLSGPDASEADGTVTYAVYADPQCTKEPEFGYNAGTVDVKGGTVPSSRVDILDNPGTYYWQASYSGDLNGNLPSLSPCGTEIEYVKGDTNLSTLLFSSSVTPLASDHDSATLSGSEASKAGGTVTYTLYSDSSCADEVPEGDAGTVTVTNGVVPTSNDVMALSGTYYWQAAYSGDKLNMSSLSPCGSEIEEVGLPTSLTTQLSSQGIEPGSSISVEPGVKVTDSANLSGGNQFASPTGTVTYKVYKKPNCTDAVGNTTTKVTIGAGASVPASNKIFLNNPGTYYWQASYSGDTNFASSTSPCGSEVEYVKAPTNLSTTLSSPGVVSANPMSVAPGVLVTDTAVLSGVETSTATGTITYEISTKFDCSNPSVVGTSSVTDGAFAPSHPFAPSQPGVYFWQASYGGDNLNDPSLSPCLSEILDVKGATTVSTALSASNVAPGTLVSDSAALGGPEAAGAGGTITYRVFKDATCSVLKTMAGTLTLDANGSVPASDAEAFETPGTYYWQAKYSGDNLNEPSTSTCGSEKEIVSSAPSATTLSTSLATSSEDNGAPDDDAATLSGANASEAGGTVTYTIYSNLGCTTETTAIAKGFAGTVNVTDGVVPDSDSETLPVGTYYWLAVYSGDANNATSTSGCEKQTVLNTES